MSRVRRVRTRLLPVLLGLFAALAAVVLTPPTTAETRVGRLNVSLRPGVGLTELEIPPLGSVTARTHSAPLTVQVGLERLELRQVSAAVSTEAGRTLAKASAESELHTAFRLHAVLCLLLTSLFAALLAAVRPSRTLRTCALTVASGVLPLVGFGVWMMASFDPSAFSSPTYHGPLSEAPAVLKKLDSAIENVSQLRHRLGVITDQLQVLTEPLDAHRDTTVILHVSDLHSNAVGVAWVDELVERFEPTAVIDTGDITSFGVNQEVNTITEVLETKKSKYLVTFGNHDSPEVRRALKERLTSIDAEVVTLGDVTVLGLDDPTYTAQEGARSAVDDPLYEKSGQRLRELCERAKPLVVAVHNPEQAKFVDSCASVVLSGHWHVPEQHRLVGGTLVSVVGTTGASGIGGLNPGGRYYAELLRFEGATLYAIDVVEMNPTTGEVMVRRIDPSRVKTPRR